MVVFPVLYSGIFGLQNQAAALQQRGVVNTQLSPIDEWALMRRPPSTGQFVGDALPLVLQRLRHALAVALQVLADAVEFDPPSGAVEAEEQLPDLVPQGNAPQVEVLLARQVADRRLHRTGLALGALDHPLEHAQVVA